MADRPHDALFHRAFERADDAAAELRAVLREPIVTAIDWGSLRPESGTFIDPRFARSESDLLFSARVGHERALIYLLLEHQSTLDRRMPLRMLSYVVRIWQRYAHKSRGRKLPIILPVLVSHDPNGWTAPTRLHELVRPNPSEIAGVAIHVPEFELIVDDLAALSNEQLRARSLAVFPRLALWLLRDARTFERLLANLREWADAFDAVASGPGGLEALHVLLRYLDLVLGDEQFEHWCGRLTELAPATEDATMHYGERKIEEGRAEGQRQMFLRLLDTKFGAPDDEIRARVGRATLDELSRWAERILVAAAIDDVFAE